MRRGNGQEILRRQRRERTRTGALLWLVLLLSVAGLALLAWRWWQETTGSSSTGMGTGSQVVGRATVTDGDTLEIGATKIRLYGIDAPESTQTCQRGRQTYPCGREAANQLSRFLGQQTVRCEKKDTDRYGRTVAVCYKENVDVNGWLVANGYALAYREYSTQYVPQESAARTAKRGIHAGTYVDPVDYRRGETTPAQSSTAQQPYPSCAAARSQGKTPVLKGEPGYNPKLDGDRDGKMCE